MSQSPAESHRVPRYEHGWEIINRMIRETTSWGGRERNCLHLGGDGGRFRNVAGASGVDFLDDGRALAILDIDRDLRPDLLLRNRTDPQLRVLRNVWQRGGRALWLRLVGQTCNRDAIGARVTVSRDHVRQAKEVQAGHLFLSQSSAWLCFGVGQAAEANVDVRWPGGGTQTFKLETNQRYVVVQGQEPRPVLDDRSGAKSENGSQELFATRQEGSRSRPLDAAGREPGLSTASWLIEPMQAPPVAVYELATRRRRTLKDFSGSPLFLHFMSMDCAVCVQEMKTLPALERQLRDVGAAILPILTDFNATPERLEEFERSASTQGTLTVADELTVTTYNLVHRHLFNLRRNLALPTLFFIDSTGNIVKVYRGRTPHDALLRDVGRLPEYQRSPRLLALPFRGEAYLTEFRRDTLSLRNALLEAGATELAHALYSESLRQAPRDVDTLFNAALAAERAGHTDVALQRYKALLELVPGHDDALNNVGVIHGRSGNPEAAEPFFRGAVEQNPANTEAVLNLGNLWVNSGRARDAIDLYHRLLKLDANAAKVHRQLGFALYRVGQHEESVRRYRLALELDPLDAETSYGLAVQQIASGELEAALATIADGLGVDANHAGLHNARGMAHGLRGDDREATAAFRQSIRLAPDIDRPYLNLARLLAERGRPGEAKQVLQELIGLQPNNPVARELLEQLR